MSLVLLKTVLEGGTFAKGDAMHTSEWQTYGDSEWI